jgi:5-methylcytosine-specific restriction endonuclease McrA
VTEYIRKPNTKCKVCEKKIYRRPGEISQNNGRVFCSHTCYGITQRQEVPCVVCGSPILSGANKKTCSRACSNTNRAGIKYKIGRPKDNVVYQRGLKLRLLKDRGHSCERCGYSKIEILHVHHKDRNREHNELENLELICPNCHFEEHYLEKSWLSGMVSHGGVA